MAGRESRLAAADHVVLNVATSDVPLVSLAAARATRQACRGLPSSVRREAASRPAATATRGRTPRALATISTLAGSNPSAPASLVPPSSG